MILIVGATGRTGNVATLDLARRGLKVRALVRNPEKAAPLAAAGVELAVGNHADSASVAQAFAGVSQLAIILPNGENQLRWETQLTEMAVAHGVRQIVKLSSMEAHPGTTRAVHRMHWQSEEQIRATGIPATMVRATFYLQNFLVGAAAIKNDNQIRFPFGDRGAASLVDSRDVGAFIAQVLATPGHEGKSYDVTSEDCLSFHQAAQVFSEVLQRPITYVPQDPAVTRANLAKVVTSPWHLDAVCAIFAEIEEGYVAAATDTFSQVMGRKPVSLKQFILDFRAAFGA